MSDYIQIPYTKTASYSYTGGSGGKNFDITGSQYYTAFAMQTSGFTVGTALIIQASLDGATWAPLQATSYLLTANPVLTTAAGIVFSIDLLAPAKGGLRIAIAASAASGGIFVSMSDSPYNTTRT